MLIKNLSSSATLAVLVGLSSLLFGTPLTHEKVAGSIIIVCTSFIYVMHAPPTAVQEGEACVGVRHICARLQSRCHAIPYSGLSEPSTDVVAGPHKLTRQFCKLSVYFVLSMLAGGSLGVAAFSQASPLTETAQSSQIPASVSNLSSTANSRSPTEPPPPPADPPPPPDPLPPPPSPPPPLSPSPTPTPPSAPPPPPPALPPNVPSECGTTTHVSLANILVASSNPPNPGLIVNCWWLDRANGCSNFGQMDGTGIMTACIDHPTNPARCFRGATYDCAHAPPPSPPPSPPPPSPPSSPPSPPIIRKVAILFAGPADHKLSPTVDYSAQVNDHILQPLKLMFDVTVLVTCSAGAQFALWKRFLHTINETTPVVLEVADDSTLPGFSRTPFVHSDSRDEENYYYQYGHKLHTYRLLKRYELEVGAPFAYVVQARNDCAYRPGHVLQPQWLDTLPCNAVAVNSVEFHQRDRWMERTNNDKTWPSLMSDQLIFGPRSSMEVYFELLLRPDMILGDGGIEGQLASFFRQRSVDVVTVELQISQPGGKFKNGHDNRWTESPCNACWQPDSGTSVAGVGKNKAALSPRRGACPLP